MNITNKRTKLLSLGTINLSDYSLKSDIYGLWICLKIFLPYTFLLFGLYISKHIFFSILISIAISIYAYKFSFIMHDCAHNSLFNSKNFCSILGNFVGLIIGSEFKSYKKTHLQHHINLGNIELDKDFDEYTFKEKIQHLIKPLFFLRILQMLKKNNMLDKDNQVQFIDKFKWILQFALIQFFIVAVISNFGQAFGKVIIYYLCLSTVSLFLGRLRTTAEHGRSINFGSDKKELTRTHHPNLIDKLLLYDANFNYHLEHHLFPQISSFQYPKIFKKLKNEIHDDNTLGASMFSTIFNLK